MLALGKVLSVHHVQRRGRYHSGEDGMPFIPFDLRQPL